MTPSAVNMMDSTPPASPLKPSMMFTAFATPPMATAVNRIDMGANDSRWSRPGTPVWVRAIPVMYQATKPLRMVASSRTWTPTSFVRSSSRPEQNAGRDAMSKGPSSWRTGSGATP